MQDIISRFSTVFTTAEIETYLFGSQENRTDLLEDLIFKFSQCTLPLDSTQSSQIPFLRGHPERLLTLDDISEARLSGIDTYDILGVTLDTSLDGISSHSDGIDPAFDLAKLGHHFMKQFWRFSEICDLDEAIFYYQECLQMFPQNDHHYLEVLLGLSSAFYHRLRLLHREKDLKQLIVHLRIQHTFDIAAVSWPNVFQGVFSAAIEDSHPSLTTSLSRRDYSRSRRNKRFELSQGGRTCPQDRRSVGARKKYCDYVCTFIFMIFCSNILSSEHMPQKMQQDANGGNGSRAGLKGGPWIPNQSSETHNAQGPRGGRFPTDLTSVFT